jgi:hypothetical protein
MWEIKRNEGGFRYIEAFGNAHNSKRIRVYIKAVCSLNDKIEFPLIGHKIITSAKGTFIIVPDEKFTIHHIEIRSGYRGAAIIHTAGVYLNETHVSWDAYHSPQGNLGFTANLIISLNQDRVISWSKSGRRIESPDTAGEVILRADGRISPFNDPELD